MGAACQEAHLGMCEPSCPSQKVEPGGFDVDYGVLRGVYLHHALRWPRIWLRPKLFRHSHRSEKIFAVSMPMEALDVFLSHSWRTPGVWKLLGLLLPMAWLHALLGWFLMTAVTLCLQVQDLLDRPLAMAVSVAGLRYECESTYWLMLAGAVGLLGGFLTSLYFPLKSRSCFLDIACVHQGDPVLLRRGISNIGGCLSMSRELQVLYHPTYFTSLWCTFELAAFRKVNPTRPILLLPLFLLGLVAVCTGWLWFSCLGSLVLANFTSSVAEIGSPHWLWISTTFLLPPTALLMHICRKKYREKHQLLVDLQSFDLDKLLCENEFDRNFILSAVDKWYGSRESFTRLVRGPLCQELLDMLPTPHLPIGFALLIATSIASLFLEMVVDLYLAGADSSTLALCILSWGSFFLCGVPIGFNLIFYLSDRLAAPGKGTLDFGKTLLCSCVVIAFIGASGGLATLSSWSGRVVFSLICFVSHVLALVWTFAPCFPSVTKRVEPE